MPIAKKKYITGAILVTLFILVSILLVPATFKWFCLLGGYVGLLLIALAYNKSYKACISTIKSYDENQEFHKVIEYINQIALLGYQGFVINSYLLYAYYEIGDFKGYEETVLKIRNGKEWTRPKFKSFKDKVLDNLACINLLKVWADTGEVQYKGSNLMVMQAVEFYKQDNPQEIITLMNDYPNVPKLKKACMYALSGQWDALDNYYESDVVNDVLNRIKERNRNG